VLFSEIINDAAKKLIDDLAISGSEGKEFSDDLMTLVNNLPQDGLAIPYSSQAPIILFTTTLKVIFYERRKQLIEEVGRLNRMLKDLILADDQNKPGAYEPSKLKSSYQFASQLINFNELSGLMPESASETITEERLIRIKSSVNILSKVEEVLFKNFATVIVSNHLQNTVGYEWDSLFTGCEIIKAKDGEGCLRAIETFNKKMTAVTEIFRAIRIGQLELKRAYDPESHDEYFKHFDWRSFSEQELNACPLIILLEDSEALIEQHLKSFFDILKLDIPVKTFAIRGMNVNKIDVKRSESGASEIKQDLASLAISHRNAFVLQSAAVDPEFLFRGFRQGLSEYSPGLFHILLPEPDAKHVDPYLWISAAVEGRGFPSITYDLQKGAQWGSRFDIGNNPNPELDWPNHQVTIINKGEKSIKEIPFTYADFASLDPSHRNEFMMVPPEYWCDELVLLSDYLNLENEQVYSSIPFIWMVDEANQLQKFAVSWALMIACRERLEFWHYIQESCGSKSYHIDQAVHKALQEATIKFQDEITTLKQSHQNEIREIEEQTATKTMKRLAEILLDLDTTSDLNHKVPDGSFSGKATALEEEIKEAPAENKKEAQTEQEEEEDISLGEPWIDTPLCTTCNECIDLNNRMFSYNENKQAYLKDPQAGTFRELVSAAENCPPKIIHPGAPINPNEDGLEELVKRAEPFN